MRTGKGLIVALLLVLLVFANSGCSKSEGRLAGAKGEESAHTPKPESTEAAEPAEEAAPKEAEQAQPATAEAGTRTASGGVDVKLFVMSYCPFGTQAENIIAKTLKALKGYVNFELHFVVDAQGTQIRSLHGQKEVDMNSVQICVGREYPDRQMEFIVEWNKKTSQPWTDVAQKLGLDTKRIQSCVDSGYGLKVQREDAKLCRELNVRASPTLIIDGNRYQGPRSSKHFFDAICHALESKGKKPPVCDNPPEYLSYADGRGAPGSCGGGEEAVDEKPYNIVVVYPEEAVWPMEAQLRMVVAQFFPKAKIERVSDKSERGKEIIRKTGISRLPAVVSTDAEFAKSKPVEKDMFGVECKKGLCFIKPEDLGANFFVDLEPRKGSFEIFYRPDSSRARRIIPEIIGILKQNDYRSKKTRILIKPFLPVSDGAPVADGGDAALEEARREAVIAELWSDSLDTYLRMLSSDYDNWDVAAKRAGIEPEALADKARSGDANSALLENADQLAHFNLGPRTDLVFLNEGRELVIVRNASEFDQLIKRLP